MGPNIVEMMQTGEVTLLDIVGHVDTRIAYGHETRWEPSDGKCHDCGVEKGEYHDPGCDMEECPVCGRQWISCGCNI